MANGKVLGVRVDQDLAKDILKYGINASEVMRYSLEIEVDEAKQNVGLCKCCGQKLPSKENKK